MTTGLEEESYMKRTSVAAAVVLVLGLARGGGIANADSSCEPFLSISTNAAGTTAEFKLDLASCYALLDLVTTTVNGYLERRLPFGVMRKDGSQQCAQGAVCRLVMTIPQLSANADLYHAHVEYQGDGGDFLQGYLDDSRACLFVAVAGKCP